MSDRIHSTAILDAEYRYFQQGKPPVGVEYRDTAIADDATIGAYVIIGRGAHFSSGVVIDHHCIVEPNVTLGRNCLLIYRAIVGGESEIGVDCVIGGFISEGCVVGDRCRIFGQLVHKQVDTTQPWDEHEVPEPSVRIGDDAFVGFNALVIGGVDIGDRSYVAAGAIVTRDVPPLHVAYGINQIVPFSLWKGALAKNPVANPQR